MVKSYYMLVTNDNLELPLCMPMQAKELAAKIGIQTDSVRFYGSKEYQRRLAKSKNSGIKRKKYKIVMVKLDLDELEEEYL